MIEKIIFGFLDQYFVAVIVIISWLGAWVFLEDFFLLKELYKEDLKDA